MSKVNFYSEKEIQVIKQAIATGENHIILAKNLSKEMKRPFQGVYYKLRKLANSSTKKTRKYTRKTSEESTDNGITLKSGFVFDFSPKRAEMFKDHVRIYF